jgi:light-regulated signal transduction histidine kinase (bacteriophytochrome)
MQEAEEALRQRTAELESVNKELEAFSFSVSHDLQAPLRKINSFIQILAEQDSNKLDEQGQEYFKRLQSSSWLCLS